MRTRNARSMLLLPLLFLLVLLSSGAACAASKGEKEMQEGLKAYGAKEFAKAADHFNRASALLEREKKIAPAADAAYNEGLCRRSMQPDTFETPEERYGRVVKAFDRAAELYEKGKNETKATNSLLQGAQAALASARLSEAEKRYADGLEKAKKLTSPLLQGLSLEGLGKIAFARGQVGESRKFFAEAHEQLKDVSSARVRVALQLTAALRKSGDMLGTLDRLEEAEKEVVELAKDERTGNLAGLLRFLVLAEQGQTYLQMGVFDRARELLQSAFEYDEQNPLIAEELRLGVDANRTVADGELGNPMYSADMLETLRQLAETRGLRDLECTSLISKGRLLRVDGKYTEAMTAFEKASRIARETGLANRYIQAVIAKANLMYFQGMWKQSENAYRTAFHDALGQSDMESILISVLGVERVARANHIGISGKVDYRKLQGVPWRGPLHQGKNARGGNIRGYDAAAVAWRELLTLAGTWFSGSQPGIRGALVVEAVSDLLAWNRMRFSGRYYVADGVLRLVASRAETVSQAAEALYEMEKERATLEKSGEAFNEDEWVGAYRACWETLAMGAGKGLLGDGSRLPSIQVSGIILVPDGAMKEMEGKATDSSEVLELLVGKIATVFGGLSLSKQEEAEFVGAFLRGEPMPLEFRKRLALSAHRHLETKSRESERLLERGETLDFVAGIAKVLEVIGSSPLDEIRESRKLAGYIGMVEREAKEARMKAAAELAKATTPFVVVTLLQALEIARIEEAWNDLSLRMAFLRTLGVDTEGANSLQRGVDIVLNAHSKGSEIFRRRFASPDSFLQKDRSERERLIAQMLSLSEELNRRELLVQLKAAARLTGLPEGETGFEDRQAMDELIARYLLALGEFRKAAFRADSVRQSFEFTARSTGGMPSPEVIWRTLLTSAKAALAEGDGNAALCFLDQGIEVMNSVSTSDGTTTQATADKLELYRVAIETAYRRWRSTSSEEDAAMLWRYLEGMKSRQWREMLSGTGAAFLDRLPEKERDRYRELHARAAQLSGLITFMSWRQRQHETEQLMTELEEVRREMNSIASRLTADFPGEIPSIGEVMRKIHPDWAVANYYLSRDFSFVFVLEKDRWRLLELPLDYDSFFVYTHWMRSLDEEFGVASPNDASTMVAGLTSLRLGEQLFKPVADDIGGKTRLLLVPHDLLYVFPFETIAVPDARQDGRGTFLLDEGWMIAEIPSAYLLLREDYRPAPNNEGRLVIMANPETWPKRPQQPEERTRFVEAYGMDFSAKSNLLLERLSVENPYLESVRRMWCPSITLLEGTEREAIYLAGVWSEHGGKKDVFTGTDVSEKTLYDPGVRAWDARYLHIACHGYDRASLPDLQPGLALSPFEDGENDSFAQMGELAAFEWRSELIALSACDTGLGELFIGDGMLGLSTVFLAGGAKGMVVSRWKVPDVSAPEMMKEMYEGIAEGRTPLEALSSAKRTMRGLRTPFHWAVFKYVGIPW